MDVIFLNTEFDNLPVFPFGDGLEDSSELALHLVGIKNLASVFWRPDEVVFEVVEAMG